MTDILLRMASGCPLICVYAVRDSFFLSQLRTHYANKRYADISFVEYTNVEADEWVASRDGLDGPEIQEGATFPHFSRPALGPIQPPIMLWACGRSSG